VNNTTSAFILPSEFKKQWEVMVFEQLLDVFGAFIDNHTTFLSLV
jgi:hypothetical protein